MQLVYLHDDHEAGVVHTQEMFATDGFRESRSTMWTANLDMSPDILKTYLETSRWIVIVSKDTEKILHWVSMFPKQTIVLSRYDPCLPKTVEAMDGVAIPGDVKRNLVHIILNLDI